MEPRVIFQFCRHVGFAINSYRAEKNISTTELTKSLSNLFVVHFSATTIVDIHSRRTQVGSQAGNGFKFGSCWPRRQVRNVRVTSACSAHSHGTHQAGFFVYCPKRNAKIEKKCSLIGAGRIINLKLCNFVVAILIFLRETDRRAFFKNDLSFQKF